jgi:hypothetical protein
MIFKLPNVLGYLIASHLYAHVRMLYVLLPVIKFHHHQNLK